jgi:hypothetical protein
VIGAPSHGGLSALMDSSASRELWRHARSNILIVNPDAPGTLTTADDWSELAPPRPATGAADRPTRNRARERLIRGSHDDRGPVGHDLR